MIQPLKKPAYCFRRWSRTGYAIFASLHKVIKIGVVTFSCSLIQVSYEPVVAQSDSTNTYTDDVTLDEVEVTAGQPILWSTVNRSVSVIEQKEIGAAPAVSVDELLKQIPGIDIRQRGPDGVQSDISLNGGSFDQVLILLNGVNITDPQTGHYNLDLPVDLSQLQRIEILHGSAARSLGSNAFTGAINLVTASDNQPSGLSGQLQLSYGSWNQLNAGGHFNVSKNDWFVAGGATRKQSDGYQANTDYQLLNTQLQVGVNNQNSGNFLLQAGYQEKAYGANSFYTFAYPNQFDYTKTVFTSVSWDKTLSNATVLQAQAYDRAHHDRFELFRDFEQAASWYTNHNYHLTNVSGGKITMTTVKSAHKTIVGAELRDEHIYSNVLGTAMDTIKNDPFDVNGFFTKRKNRFISSLFIDHSLYLDQLWLSGGFSVNYTPDFSLYWNGGLDASFRFSKALTARLNWNRAVRLPSFTDLYYKSATQLSNPALKPERANTLEAGLDWHSGVVQLSANSWYRMGNNLIDWVKLPDSTKWESQNLTNVNAGGFTFQADYLPREQRNNLIGRFSAGYTLQRLNKKANGYDSKYALDYLRQKMNFQLGLNLMNENRAGAVYALLEAGYFDRAGTYTDFVSQQLTSYPSYWLFNTRMSWKKSKTTVYVDLNNLFNTANADFGGLAQPGRAIRGGVVLIF